MRVLLQTSVAVIVPGGRRDLSKLHSPPHRDRKRRTPPRTPTVVLAILKKIASSTYSGRRGVALIDEVCSPYNLTDADVSRVKHRLVEEGYIINVSVVIVAEGINRASQFFY